MATPLNKTITREAELNGTTYHVSLTPDPEPSVLIREKGKRGRGASTPLSQLLDAAPAAPVAATPASTGEGLDNFQLPFSEVMSKLHVELGNDIPTLQRMRDILRDIYTVSRMADMTVSDEELAADERPLAD